MLISKSMIENSAIQNFSCEGLDSYILNTKKVGNHTLKTRLFVANSNCELKQTLPSIDGSNIVIPIHGHKYIDELIPLTGKIADYIFEKNPIGKFKFKEYQYPRLDDEFKLKETGNSVNFTFMSVKNHNHIIQGNQFHTVRVESHAASWLIIEREINPLFEQVCYMENLNGLSKHSELNKKLFDVDIDRIVQKLEMVFDKVYIER